MPPTKPKSDSLVFFDPEQLPFYTPLINPIPPPAADYGEDMVCIAIDRKYIPYLITSLQIYAQRDAWIGDLATRKWAKGQINRMWTSIASLESCEGQMFDLRENPADECEIQKSTDGGVTWEYAWRKDNCAPLYSEDILNASFELLYSDFVSRTLVQYDGTVSSIYPPLVYAEDGQNGDRDNALCYALMGLVDLLMAAAIEYINDTTLFLNSGKAALQLIGRIALIVSPPIGAWVFLGTSIAGAAIDILNNVLLVGAEAYEDIESKQVLACAMFEKLYGQTITFAAFNDALSDFTPTGVTQPIQVHAAEPFLDDVNIYISFLDTWNKAKRMAGAGLLDMCDCVTWTIERLGGDGNANMVSMLIDGATGTYNSTLDRYEGAASAGKRHLLVMMESPMLPFFVTSIGCNLTIDNNGTVNTHNYIADTSGEGAVNAQLTVGTNFVDGPHTLGVNDVDAQKLGIAFRLECQGTAGYVRLNKVTISGRGFNPFE